MEKEHAHSINNDKPEFSDNEILFANNEILGKIDSKLGAILIILLLPYIFCFAILLFLFITGSSINITKM